MNKFERFLLGIVLCLFCFAVLALSSPYLSESKPVSAAAVTLDSRVKSLEVTQANLLKRVGMLETVVASQTMNMSPSKTPTPSGNGKNGIDDLGIHYEFVQVDKGITVAGWEAYENSDGYWSVAGNIQNKHLTDRFSVVDFKVRFYKDQRLVQVTGISAGGRWVAPGQSLPFEFASSVKLKEFDRYTIEAIVGDWGKAP